MTFWLIHENLFFWSSYICFCFVLFFQETNWRMLSIICCCWLQFSNCKYIYGPEEPLLVALVIEKELSIIERQTRTSGPGQRQPAIGRRSASLLSYQIYIRTFGRSDGQFTPDTYNRWSVSLTYNTQKYSKQIIIEHQFV